MYAYVFPICLIIQFCFKYICYSITAFSLRLLFFLLNSIDLESVYLLLAANDCCKTVWNKVNDSLYESHKETKYND
jgi:hypothetical protein